MVITVKNPMIEENLVGFRNKHTTTYEAWMCVEKISYFLAGEASKLLNTSDTVTVTPLGEAAGKIIADKIELIPVLRAGLAMLRPFQELYPNAHIGPIACQRNHDLSITVSYEKISRDLRGSTVIILDTMLATGNTVKRVIDLVEQRGALKIVVVNILSVQMGLEHLAGYPVITAGDSDTLDANYYVFPGVGDSGDRLFGSITEE